MSIFLLVLTHWRRVRNATPDPAPVTAVAAAAMRGLPFSCWRRLLRNMLNSQKAWANVNVSHVTSPTGPEEQRATDPSCCALASLLADWQGISAKAAGSVCLAKRGACQRPDYHA
ncbi:MAG TPA: hypothetical protein PL117_06310 [Accumulibacter sp.]|uniref:hypothetical protein n=1 Tax=Accumulibacter sp. TaxID=2053492 RepID=UPI002C231C66|nr:hypothetical protein [Accumulibacter sp.]HRF72371.1 hypothetical protein [Accumulibacter sp.]